MENSLACPAAAAALFRVLREAKLLDDRNRILEYSKMNRQELQELSRIRRKEAAALIKIKHYPGAYYLLGYSVECALKACIAKQTNKYDFPNKDLADKAYVHNLEQLIRLAGLENDLNNDIQKNKALEVNWAVVKDWKESSRYNSTISPEDAKDLYSACTSRTNGMLSWIKTKW